MSDSSDQPPLIREQSAIRDYVSAVTARVGRQAPWRWLQLMQGKSMDQFDVARARDVADDAVEVVRSDLTRAGVGAGVFLGAGGVDVVASGNAGMVARVVEYVSFGATFLYGAKASTAAFVAGLAQGFVHVAEAERTAFEAAQDALADYSEDPESTVRNKAMDLWRSNATKKGPVDTLTNREIQVGAAIQSGPLPDSGMSL